MSDAATMDTDTNADTGQQTQADQQAPAKFTGPSPGLETRWFDKYLPADAGEAREKAEKVFRRYASQDEAIATIPERERLIGTRVDFPDPALPPEEAEKVHRKILGKLGAAKNAADYKADELLKGLDDSVRKAIPTGFIEECQQQAAELGLLPWQFERQLAMALAAHEANVRAQQDRRDAAEREMKRIFGHRLTEKMGVAEQGADLIDADLFAEEMAAMGEGERTERGGPLKQLLRDANSPVLYRLMAFVHDRVFAEGEPAPHGQTQARQDEWTKVYKRCLANNPARGVEFAKKYADDYMKERGG